MLIHKHTVNQDVKILKLNSQDVREVQLDLRHILEQEGFSLWGDGTCTQHQTYSLQSWGKIGTRAPQASQETQCPSVMHNTQAMKKTDTKNTSLVILHLLLQTGAWPYKFGHFLVFAVGSQKTNLNQADPGKETIFKVLDHQALELSSDVKCDTMSLTKFKIYWNNMHTNIKKKEQEVYPSKNKTSLQVSVAKRRIVIQTYFLIAANVEFKKTRIPGNWTRGDRHKHIPCHLVHSHKVKAHSLYQIPLSNVDKN